MNITLRQLRALVAVTRAASFTAAARELGMTQSAVSTSIRHLEAELGLSLFRRDTRNVTATDPGRDLAGRVERLMQELETALDDVRSAGERQRGRVRIAALPSVVSRLLPRCLAECRQRFPEIEIAVADLAADDVAPAVLAGRADFGIVNEGVEALPDALGITLLGRDRFCLVCRRDEALARKANPTWHDLARRDLVLPDRHTGSRALIDQVLADQGIAVRVVQEMSRPEAVAGLVAAGIGLAVLPELSVPGPDHPELTFRRLTEPAAFRRLVLVHAPERPLTGAAAVVAQTVRRIYAGRT